MVTQTICEVGCLMSSVAMALNGKGIAVNNTASNPAVFNSWLVNNHGYVDSDLLDESVVPNINTARISYSGAMFNNTALSPSAIKSLVSNMKSVVIINVLQGRHFVLVVGYDDTDINFYVNDPYFATASYLYSDIVGYRIFTMV